MVAGQHDPADVCLLRHRAKGLAQGVGGRGFRVETVARQQHDLCTALPGGLGQTPDGGMTRLAQAVADTLGIAAEGLAQMQVRCVQKAECHA